MGRVLEFVPRDADDEVAALMEEAYQKWLGDKQRAVDMAVAQYIGDGWRSESGGSQGRWLDEELPVRPEEQLAQAHMEYGPWAFEWAREE